MQGQILDYSIQDNGGVIRGDDGKRYTFTGTSWQAAVPPRVGARVDFDPDGDTATGIYAVAVSNPAPGPTVGAGAPTLATAGAPVSAVYPGAVVPVSTLGTLGMCAGFLAIIFFQTTLLGFPLMLAGWTLSITGLITGKGRGEQVGFAIAGIMLSTIPLVVNAIIAISVYFSVGAVHGRSGGLFKAIISQVVPFI